MRTTNSMRCPECGELSAVTDSRWKPGIESTWRKRVCTSCGYKWKTYEIDADQLKLLMEKAEVKPVMLKVKEHVEYEVAIPGHLQKHQWNAWISTQNINQFPRSVLRRDFERQDK